MADSLSRLYTAEEEEKKKKIRLEKINKLNVKEISTLNTLTKKRCVLFLAEENGRFISRRIKKN